MSKLKITLPELISLNNPRAGREIVTKYGLPAARTPRDLYKKLSFILKRYKEEALADLADAHPDKDLILHYNQTLNFVSEKNSNACGCSSHENKSNCNGSLKCDNCENFGGWSNIQGDIEGIIKKELNQKNDKGFNLPENLPLILAGTLLASAIFVNLKG